MSSFINNYLVQVVMQFLFLKKGGPFYFHYGTQLVQKISATKGLNYVPTFVRQSHV